MNYLSKGQARYHPPLNGFNDRASIRYYYLPTHRPSLPAHLSSRRRRVEYKKLAHRNLMKPRNLRTPNMVYSGLFHEEQHCTIQNWYGAGNSAKEVDRQYLTSWASPQRVSNFKPEATRTFASSTGRNLCARALFGVKHAGRIVALRKIPAVSAPVTILCAKKGCETVGHQLFITIPKTTRDFRDIHNRIADQWLCMR